MRGGYQSCFALPRAQAKRARAAWFRDEGVAAISLCAGAMAAATTERQSLLAPESVTRLSTHVQEVRADMWEITMGDAVPAFVFANGPPKVVTYNFLLGTGATVESHLVTRRPVDRSRSEFQDKHDLADLFDLTPLGKSCLKAQPNKQVSPT